MFISGFIISVWRDVSNPPLWTFGIMCLFFGGIGLFASIQLELGILGMPFIQR